MCILKYLSNYYQINQLIFFKFYKGMISVFVGSDNVISSLTIGGLTAVIYTDTIQAFLMVGGGLTLMGLGKEIKKVRRYYIKYQLLH